MKNLFIIAIFGAVAFAFAYAMMWVWVDYCGVNYLWAAGIIGLTNYINNLFTNAKRRR